MHKRGFIIKATILGLDLYTFCKEETKAQDIFCERVSRLCDLCDVKQPPISEVIQLFENDWLFTIDKGNAVEVFPCIVED